MIGKHEALEAEVRLIVQATEKSLERVGREITRAAAAKGTLLSGGTVRTLGTALVEQLEIAANLLIAAHVKTSTFGAKEIATRVLSKLDPVANDFLESHANLSAGGLQAAFELLRREIKRFLDSLADRATVALASQVDDERRFALIAIEEALKSVLEDERPHPKVGAVVVKNGSVLSKAHRGENPKSHAEYIALEDKLSDDLVAGATVYTTLEPCTTRNHPKIPCAQRLVERKVARVVIGMLDPNPEIRGLGEQLLSEANIETQLFPRDLKARVEEMNREFIRVQKQRQTTRKTTHNADPKVGAILSFKGKVVTVFNRQKWGHSYLESYWANGAIVTDCNELWVELEDPATGTRQSFSLTNESVAFDNDKNRLRLDLER